MQTSSTPSAGLRFLHEVNLSVSALVERNIKQGDTAWKPKNFVA
jgi:hypothetical protein